MRQLMLLAALLGGASAFGRAINIDGTPGDGTVAADGLSRYDVIVAYDGQAHTIDTAALKSAANAAIKVSCSVKYTTEGASSQHWSSTAPSFADVGEHLVWYRVSAFGYDTYVHAAKVTITEDTSRTTDTFTVTPYVQHPATNGMSILFFTKKASSATVRCWPDGADGEVLTQTAQGVVASDLVSTGHSSDVPVWGTQYRHRVRFEGLRGGTAYRYAVELADGAAYTNAFRTAPDRDTPVKFVAYSDSETTPKTSPASDWDVEGHGSAQTYYVSRSVGFAANIRHMRAWEPDFVVIAGDLVARGGVQMFWDEFWKHNAGAFNDIAGATPILAALGNHDLYDNKGTDAYGYNYNDNGEFALKKYLTYFEYNPNDVDYAAAAAAEQDSRDKSQLFHREDYGPVTLIFLDTNNGDDSNSAKDTNTSLKRSGANKARSPDFNEGSLQYKWLEENLADARQKARFTFVVCHHCPYSVGKHNLANGTWNGSETEAVSAQAVRVLTPLLHKYGVTAWLCGHDEIQEHSQHVGEETRPDGTVRRHVLNVYDLGSAGDGLRGKAKAENPYEVFRAYSNATDGVHYGHLRVEAKPNAQGVWQCSLTPVYSYMEDGNGTSELRTYADRIVIDEQGEVLYEQRKGVTLVEGDGLVRVADDGSVTVAAAVRQLLGVAPEKVKIVHREEVTKETFDITSAFSVEGTEADGVTISLNRQGSATFGTDAEAEVISVVPTLTDAEDEIKPLSVDAEVDVGIRTIPGLVYRLRRGESVSEAKRGRVVAEERAHGVRTRLVDRFEGERPTKAFYSVEAGTD